MITLPIRSAQVDHPHRAVAEPELGQVETTEPGGWNYLRVEFKIWPGQGTLIETIFRQQITFAMKAFDPNLVALAT